MRIRLTAGTDMERFGQGLGGKTLSRAFAAVALAALLAGLTNASDTTFYVVRHAERPSGVEGGSDPPLTVQGMRRAEELRDVLEGVRISAIYSTRTLRTWQTGTPTASRAGVAITAYDHTPPAFFNNLKARHDGQSVLIVGHSDTVGTIIEGLGGSAGAPIGNDFDNLFVVTIDGAMTRTERRKFGVLEEVRRVDFSGVRHQEDLSAVVTGPASDEFVVASDEGATLQVLRRAGDEFVVRSLIGLGADEDEEIDVEGIARHGPGTIYFVAGSHAFRRKNIFRDKDSDATLAEIRERFEVESPDRERDRERIIRVEIDPTTGRPVVDSVGEFSLRDVIDNHTVLGPFGRLPATENGVDIEGIASDGERLFLGFRGPVFRFGFTPVLVFRPENPEEKDLRYLRLNGLGVRDLARIRDGFLVIAGPVGESSSRCHLYHWDGNSELPGKRGAVDLPLGRSTRLGAIPAPPGAEPEGIAVLDDDDSRAQYEILIVYDGVAGGQPTVFRVPKPSGS